MCKINWDVGVDKGPGRIGIWLILRDHEGKVLTTRSLAKIFLVDTTVAKALATLQAVEFVVRWASI